MAIVSLTKLKHAEIERNSEDKVQAFQRKIYLKAKENPEYKFYCMYDKVFRRDFLEKAFFIVKRNKWKGGVDGKEFSDYEKGQEQELIDEIQKELKGRTYKPSPLREVQIPKGNGKMRILKIPTIKDRVVQMSLKLVIEPIFEADFKENSYGYRPKKGAHDAVWKLGRELKREVFKTEVTKEVKNVDLSRCFDTIPHKELMNIIAKRLIDRETLKLVKMFLTVGIMEEEINWTEKEKGTPQWGVISPLLANIYLDKIDEYRSKTEIKGEMIRYADDIVIVMGKEEEGKYQKFLTYIEEELKLVVNREKTKIENLESGINYLWFCLRKKKSKKQKDYLSIEPNKKAMKKIKATIKMMIKHSWKISTEDVIGIVNRRLKGRQGYFDNIWMWKTRNHLNRYVGIKMRKFISKRKKNSRITRKLFKERRLYNEYGLYYLENTGRILTD